jgi:Flp pilus assembly protein TadD
MAPYQANALYYLGRALLRRGDVAEAASALTRAVKLAPADASARNCLAVALAKQGSVDRAIVEIKAALSLEPENALLQENLACLEKGGGCALSLVALTASSAAL